MRLLPRASIGVMARRVISLLYINLVAFGGKRTQAATGIMPA
jgi:hypothetical protein